MSVIWSRKPVVAASLDGRLEVFLQLSEMYHIWQLPTAGWSNWYSHGRVGNSGFSESVPAITSNADGRLELFACDTDTKALYHKWQLAPNASWSDWFGFPSTGTGLSGVQVGQSAEHRIECFVVASDGNLYHVWQTANGWSNWFNHGQQNEGFYGT